MMKKELLKEPTDIYQERFLELWEKLHDSKNGYFSSKGIPYHSIETLMVEAPDYGHVTTSEALSYYIWLEAMYGKFTGDFSKFKKAWDITETYIIPSEKDQPNSSMSGYNPGKPAPMHLNGSFQVFIRQNWTLVQRLARIQSTMN